MKRTTRAIAGPLRSLAITIACAAVYGFCIGSGKNLTYAWRSAVKFPLLLLGTAVCCTLAWFVLARFLGTSLRVRDVVASGLGLFRTLAVLLASLAPVTIFLGRSVDAADATSLGGYPTFVGANMIFVAVAGSLAVMLQVRDLVLCEGIVRRRARRLVAAWLVVSLLVGGQLAFWMRPFFGITSLTGDPPFVLGDEPTVTGARNFYEVLWQFVTGAAPGDYTRRR